MEEYKAFLSQNEQDIRNCYWEKCPAEKFVEMIQLDAVFIMELFLRNSEISTDGQKENKNKKSNDYLFTILWLKEGIKQDLLLLENQLPLFVLQRLADICEESLTSLTNNYFGYNNENISKFKHFTDLERYNYLPLQLVEPINLNTSCASEELIVQSLATRPRANQEPKEQPSAGIVGPCASEEPKQPLLDKKGGQDATEEPKWQFLDKIVGPFKTSVTRPIQNCNYGDPDDIRVSATKLKAAGIRFKTANKNRLVSVHLCMSFLNL